MREHLGRNALGYALSASALVALTAAGVAAAKHGPPKGQGQVIVSPPLVTARASGKTLRFTFLATTGGAASGGAATFTFPASWPSPHKQGSKLGRIATSASSCSRLSITGVSHSVVTIHMTCKKLQSFALTYGGVTVPAKAGKVTFEVRTADGTIRNHKHAFGPLHPIGTSPVLTVSGAAQTHFAVSAPSSVVAGTSAGFTVTAVDGGGHTVTGYRGTVHFTSSDGAAMLPPNTQLKAGVGTFSAVLKTPGSQTITATDTVTHSLTGKSRAISVGPGPATHLSVTAPSSGTAGSALTFTVKALDQLGNTATGYSGTVHFTSSDGVANLPANTTLSSGSGTFSDTPTAAGNQSITATDTAMSSINGTSAAIAVAAGATTKLIVSPASSTAVAGTAFTVVVTAEDQFGNTSSGYGGTVHFTSSDTAAVLPSDSTLPGGSKSFSVTLKTVGTKTITATDTSNSSFTGVSGSITVSGGATTHFAVTTPATATAGSAFSFTVTALDSTNSTVTGYSGVVHFTSSDGAAVLPANSTLTNGTGTFSATLKTAGSQTITATDTVTGSITGTSAATSVGAAAATRFAVSAPSTATSGTAFSFTIIALDQFGNLANGYAGTVHFTTSAASFLLPANSTLTNGSGTFSATLNTSGGQTITGTDTVTSSITGTSNTVTVT